MKQLAKYLGQRSFSSKLIAGHTDTHTGLTSLPGPLKYWVITHLSRTDCTIVYVVLLLDVRLERHLANRSVIRRSGDTLLLMLRDDLGG